MAGKNASNARQFDAYGGASRRNAGRFQGQYSAPMSRAFGWNTGEHFLEQLSKRAGEGNPFAQYLQTTRNNFAPMQADAARAGQEIATRAPGAFQGFMDQAQGFLDQLPGWQAQFGEQMDRAQNAVDLEGAQHGVDVAKQALDQASSPIQSQALYQNALRQNLASSRQGAAGRGLLDAGSQQGQEDTISRDLAGGFAQNQFSNQQQALQGYGGALGGQGQLAQLLGQLTGQRAQGQLELGQAGLPISEQIMQMIPQYAQMLMGGSQLPFSVAQQLQGFLGASQNPTLSLLQATAPQVANESKGWNVL